MTRSFLVAAAAAASMLVVATPAGAGTYSVFGCQGPDGTPNAAAGWSAAQVGAASTGNDCASGGTLFAALGVDPPGGSVARWRFDAPADTRLVRVGARRRTVGVSKSDRTLDSTYELSTDSAILEKCALSSDSSCTADLVEPLDKQGLDGGWARFSVVCSMGGDERCTKALRAEIAQVVVGLKDDSPPLVSGTKVVDDGETSGVLRLRFDAADRGAGVYRELVKVDGRLHAVAPLGLGDCADAAPADADPYQFTVPVPCPPLVPGVPVEIRAADLGAGPHTIEVEVEDAAGNAKSVFVTQFPRPNVGAGGASTPEAVQALLDARLNVWFDRNRRASLTSRFGRRVVVRGVLRNRRTRRGVVGARVDVYHLVGRKLRRLGKTGLKTRAGGKLTLILPLDIDTRRLVFAYRALRPGPITSQRRLRVTVRDRRGKVVRRVR
jgi:hypothetical protein